jgi:translation initiation factor IF-3
MRAFTSSRRLFTLPFVESFAPRLHSTARDFLKNENIQEKHFKLIGIDGKVIGDVSLKDALHMRTVLMQDGVKVDLLQIKTSTESDVGLCRLSPVKTVAKVERMEKQDNVDMEKSKEKSKEKPKKIKLQELRITSQIDENDLMFKVKNVAKWLDKGSDVSISIRRSSGGQKLDLKASFAKFEHVIELLNASGLIPTGKVLSIIKKPSMTDSIVSGLIRLVDK